MNLETIDREIRNKDHSRINERPNLAEVKEPSSVNVRSKWTLPFKVEFLLFRDRSNLDRLFKKISYF